VGLGLELLGCKQSFSKLFRLLVLSLSGRQKIGILMALGIAL
jgi:hypothetical protein